MNRIDDKLSNHIKTVFDTFEDSNADKGWAELRKKYPGKNSIKPLFLWGSGIAASILLALFIVFSQDGQKSIIADPDQTVKHVNPGPVASDRAPSDSIKQTPPNNGIAQNTSANGNQQDLVAEEDALPETNAINSERADPAMANPLSTVPAQRAGITGKNIPEKADAKGKDAEKKSGLTEQDAIAKTAEPDRPKDKQSFTEFLENEAKTTPLLASATTTKKKDGGITSFDLFAGTFVNYFEDNPVQLNAGFGVNANIKVSKKIYLSVGAGVSENTIAYENSLPRASVQSMMESFPVQSTKAPFPTTKSAPSTDMKINATLLNLDVPIAVKFYTGKTGKIYLLTGINSNSYINQKYVQSYSTVDYSTNARTVNEREVEESKLKGFDFANSAIFAVGVSQEIGKKNMLIFEPFFKPSLRGLGDKNIRLNTIGLNLKLNIHGQK